jgi:hypothetical protein
MPIPDRFIPFPQAISRVHSCTYRSWLARTIATRGSQAWRGLLGTVTQALLYHSPAPVAIVRASHDLYVQE